jgi:CRP-like cAMP-binding protein
MLKKGKVKVYTISPEGKRLIVETITPGTFFDEMSLTAISMHESC